MVQDSLFNFKNFKYQQGIRNKVFQFSKISGCYIEDLLELNNGEYYY